MFDQPRCRDFVLLLQRWIARNYEFLRLRSFVEILVLLFREHRILEERSRALTIGVPLNDQHALTSTNVAHGLSHLRESGSSLPTVEVPRQVRVLKMRLSA